VTSGERLQRIYIVGFMGVGKTSVGECLAKELRYGFVDLDREIERAAGRTIPEIFKEEGEPFFRRLEAQALRSVGGQAGIVVACGGGTLSLQENREFVRRVGISVWLDAPLDVMLRRCGTSLHRPLLADRPRMEALLAERLPVYREADIRIDASADPPELLASRIASKLARLH
jgi:shikimate kinase